MTEAYSKPQLIAAPDEANPLEAIARRGARVMLQAALEREVEEFLGRRVYKRTSETEEFRSYRNGYNKERGITVGSGTVEVSVPRVSHTPPAQEPFESKIVAPYQKRSRAFSELFPKLFVEGLATRDFEPALRALLGSEAALSPSTISRLNQKFKAEYDEWRHSSLKDHHLSISGRTASTSKPASAQKTPVTRSTWWRRQLTTEMVSGTALGTTPPPSNLGAPGIRILSTAVVGDGGFPHQGRRNNEDPSFDNDGAGTCTHVGSAGTPAG